MGGGNLGDDATQTAVIHNIKKRWPEAEIIGFSMNPEDTRKRHGIPSYPIRRQIWKFGGTLVSNRVTFKETIKTAVGRYRFVFRLLKAIYTVAIKMPRGLFKELSFLTKSFRIIRSLDLLIINGGGQLVESWHGSWKFLGGPWHFPYTIFKWVLLARVARVKRIFLNVGAGPLIHRLSKWFVRRALFSADYVSFRDENSKALAVQIGFTGRMHVFPDSVYSLDVPAVSANRLGRGCQCTVGLAPMAYSDPRLSLEHDRHLYESFIGKLGLFSSWLVGNHYGLTLFCTDIGVDPPAIDDLVMISRSDNNIIDAIASGSHQRVHQWTLEELLLNMASMDYVITCRFHGVVFAHMLNIPVLALSYHSKTDTLMKDLGLSEYCLDIQNFDLNGLTEGFLSLVSNRGDIKSRMAERLACYKKELSSEFDALFAQEPFC
jgi:polysaccharide pyruvyl transferase WcaK-like protein